MNFALDPRWRDGYRVTKAGIRNPTKRRKDDIMRRILKALLLASMVVAAMSAFSIASAQAFTKFTNPNGGNTTIVSTPDGTGKTAHHVTVTPAGSITCSTVDFHGTTSVVESEVTTLTPICTNATFAGIGTTIAQHECDYSFHINGSVDIKCPVGHDITWEAAGCKITILPQDGLSGPSGVAGVVYHNITSSTEITFSMSLVSIHGEASGCASGNGTFTNGEYTTGNTILTGEEDSTGSHNMKPISVS
jgi:hypothetical protein